MSTNELHFARRRLAAYCCGPDWCLESGIGRGERRDNCQVGHRFTTKLNVWVLPKANRGIAYRYQVMPR